MIDEDTYRRYFMNEPAGPERCGVWADHTRQCLHVKNHQGGCEFLPRNPNADDTSLTR